MYVDTTPCSDTINVQMICNQSDTSDDGNHYYDGVSVCGEEGQGGGRESGEVACRYIGELICKSRGAVRCQFVVINSSRVFIRVHIKIRSNITQ